MAHPKSTAGYRVGIVNPLTLVGQEIRSILRERGFPYAKIALLDSSGESAGALTEIENEPAVVSPVAQEGLDDLDLVFFCGPSAKNEEWIARHDQDDFIAVDLSRPATSEGRAVVAGVNLDEASGDDVLVSPHPAAIPIALVLHQLQTLTPVELCVATVVQPASEFDQGGVEELAQQSVSVLNLQPIPKKVFDRQAAFNLYPSPGTDEEIVVSQLRALTNPRSELAVMITQGTIFHGYTFSLFLRTRESLDVSQVTGALRENDAFAFAEGDQRFGTIDAAGRDEVLIAEVRADPSIRGGFWVWAVCDNLRRSSALNAVLAAEKALFGSGSVH